MNKASIGEGKCNLLNSATRVGTAHYSHPAKLNPNSVMSQLGLCKARVTEGIHSSVKRSLKTKHKN